MKRIIFDETLGHDNLQILPEMVNNESLQIHWPNGDSHFIASGKFKNETARVLIGVGGVSFTVGDSHFFGNDVDFSEQIDIVTLGNIACALKTAAGSRSCFTCSSGDSVTIGELLEISTSHLAVATDF